MRHYENVVYPTGCKGIIDVTKAPYFADNTGTYDCTDVLKKILDDILQPNVDEIEEIYGLLKDAPDGTCLKGNNRKADGNVYALSTYYMNQAPTLYFPNGTYLVSDTISYTLEKLHNMIYFQTSGGHEMNCRIRFMGQNREKTVIKLKDNCKGFEFGQERPVVNFMQSERSNVSYSNYFENITIDTGIGNPGAVGIVFFASNSGAVRNVTIRSSDPEHVGAVGILIRNEFHSGCNFYNVLIDGFNYGVRIMTYRTNSHFEDLTVNNQRKYGIQVSNNSAQFIGLKSHNNVPVLNVANGVNAQVTVTDAELTSDGTIYEAIKLEVCCCVFLRNIQTKGFRCAVDRCWKDEILPDGYVDEYMTMAPMTLFDTEAKSLSLQVPPVPDLPRLPLEDWCCVNDFGAVGDGATDDTAAIQAAFNSGKKVIWFQPGRYFLSDSIDIPETVEHVHFMHCDLAATDELRLRPDDGVFRIKGQTDKPILIEKLIAWYEVEGTARMFRHDSKRTVIIRDVHTQAVGTYYNTVPGGEVFLENVACTVGKKDKYGHVPCFYFDRQTVWCHAINPERSLKEVVNKGGQLWWSGFKTEQEGSICITTDGGVSEILGGVAVVGHGSDIALIHNEESTVSAIFTNSGYHHYSDFPVAVREIRNGEERIIRDSECPQRGKPWYFMPLYVGRKKDK